MSGTRPKDNPSLPAGLQVFGEYIVDKPIEEGPVWRVYRALHVQRKDETYHLRALRSTVAMRRDLIEAFARYARLLESLSHPGVIPVRANGVDQGGIFMVTPEVIGTTLREKLSKSGRKLDPAEALRVVREVGAVLDYIHTS